MSELKSRLPSTNPDVELEAFLTGIAVQAIEESTQEAVYPWQQAHIRADVSKVYNLRLSEAYMLKLKYIAEHTPDSMQKFCLSVLEKAIDDKINALLK
jgi:predicted DNA binding CopG/RHH family protein